MFLQQITVRLDKILMQVLMIIINGFFISTTKLQVVVILIQILAQIQLLVVVKFLTVALLEE